MQRCGCSYSRATPFHIDTIILLCYNEKNTRELGKSEVVLILTEKRTTLKDVAAKAKVSMMTASKVLNNKGGISKGTSDRVFKAAQELNYTPNLLAKGLRLDQSRTIGVVMADGSLVSHIRVLNSIVYAAEVEQYGIIIGNSINDKKKEQEVIKTMLNQRIAGLILVGSNLTGAAYADWLARLYMPVVLLLRESETKQVTSVINDNFTGGFELGRLMREAGREKMVFFGLPIDYQIGIDRLAGVQKALSLGGNLIPDNSIYHMTASIEAAHDQFCQLMEGGKSLDAVICGSDLQAVGVIRACHELGLRVPEDICVSGYDDIDIARYITPPLTTMRQPFEEIGRKGLELLLSQIENPSQPLQRIIMQSQLIERQSTIKRK